MICLHFLTIYRSYSLLEPCIYAGLRVKPSFYSFLLQIPRQIQQLQLFVCHGHTSLAAFIVPEAGEKRNHFFPALTLHPAAFGL